MWSSPFLCGSVPHNTYCLAAVCWPCDRGVLTGKAPTDARDARIRQPQQPGQRVVPRVRAGDAAVSIGLTVVGGCAALILDYFAFVTVRLARDHDTDGDFVSYADRPWGKTDPAVPLPYVVLFIVLGIVGCGLVIRTWGPPRRLAAERL